MSLYIIVIVCTISKILVIKEYVVYSDGILFELMILKKLKLIDIAQNKIKKNNNICIKLSFVAKFPLKIIIIKEKHIIL